MGGLRAKRGSSMPRLKMIVVSSPPPVTNMSARYRAGSNTSAQAPHTSATWRRSVPQQPPTTVSAGSCRMRAR